jgi:hypothetical protein
MPRFLAIFALIAFTLGVSPVVGDRDASSIVHKMLARNPALGSYRSRVHVDLHMTNFPFLAPKLDGTSYFRRPDNYEVTFDRMPGYAKGFSNMFNDVADPGAWGKNSNIMYDGLGTADGRPMLILRITPKIRSDILAYTLAFVDPRNYTLPRMEWHYVSGGLIVMTQAYRDEGTYSLIGAQHVTIDIPHVHAVGDATYGAYQTNVAVDATVFTPR